MKIITSKGNKFVQGNKLTLIFDTNKLLPQRGKSKDRPHRGEFIRSINTFRVKTLETAQQIFRKRNKDTNIISATFTDGNGIKHNVI